MVFNLYSKELKLLQVTSNYISTNFHRTENVHKWDECKSLLIYFISKKHVYVYVKKNFKSLFLFCYTQCSKHTLETFTSNAH